MLVSQGRHEKARRSQGRVAKSWVPPGSPGCRSQSFAHLLTLVSANLSTSLIIMPPREPTALEGRAAVEHLAAGPIAGKSASFGTGML